MVCFVSFFRSRQLFDLIVDGLFWNVKLLLCSSAFTVGEFPFEVIEKNC